MAGQEKMSKADAGRLGAQARKEKLGPEGLSASARKAAKTVEERRPGFHAEIGSRGGKAGGKRGDSGGRDESEE